jgi:hypothetical protein
VRPIGSFPFAAAKFHAFIERNSQKSSAFNSLRQQQKSTQKNGVFFQTHRFAFFLFN